MWHSLRTRLLLASIGVAVLAVLTLSCAVLYVTRDNMLKDLNQHLSGQTQQHASELAQWIGDKRRLTSSIRLAMDQSDPMPMLQAAEKPGWIWRTLCVQTNPTPSLRPALRITTAHNVAGTSRLCKKASPALLRPIPMPVRAGWWSA